MCPSLMDDYISGGNPAEMVLRGKNIGSKSIEEDGPQKPLLKRLCDDLRSMLAVKHSNDSILIPSTQTARISQSEVDRYPLDLALATIQARDSHRLGAAQQEGKQEWHTWRFRHASGLILNAKGHLSESDTLALVQCFSKMFFLPRMRSVQCEYKWIDGLAKKKNKNAYGLTDHLPQPDGEYSSREFQVRLDPGDFRKDLELGTQVEVSCSILLHEMIHVYILACSCDGIHTRSNECTRNGRILWPTGSGHCVAWFHLACHIELCMSRICPGFQVNLTVLPGLLQELQAGGLPLVAAEWARFFDSYSWVEACGLFDRLHPKERDILRTHLAHDPFVMAVFANQA